MSQYRAIMAFAAAAIILGFPLCFGLLGIQVADLRWLLLASAAAGLGIAVAFVLLGVAEAGGPRVWVGKLVRWSTVLLYVVAVETLAVTAYLLAQGEFGRLIPPAAMLICSLLAILYWPSATRELGRPVPPPQ